MKERIYAILEVAFIALFCFSVFKLVEIGLNYMKGDEIYEGSKDYLVETEKSTDENYFEVDIEGLQEVNPDIIGWIRIPNTPVDYPLLQPDNNDYYLKHTYNDIYSDFGSIFIDYRSDFYSDNTLIYGHNTKNDSMFGSLKKYKQKDYFDEHPYIYIIYGDKLYKYAIIAALTVETSDPVYTFNFDDKDELAAWIDDLVSRSEVETNKEAATGNEHVLTLSTCTSRTKTERFVVIAEEVGRIWGK